VIPLSDQLVEAILFQHNWNTEAFTMGQGVWIKGNFETDTPKQVNAEVTEEVVRDSNAIAILPFGPYAPSGGMEPGLTSEVDKHASAGAPN
jgi:hypothetical protein